MDQDNHSVIKAQSSYGNFAPSLVLTCRDRRKLEPGQYMLMVDTRWNKIADDYTVLKKVKIRVTSPEPL